MIPIFSDVQLLRRFHSGDRDAFDDIFVRYHGHVYDRFRRTFRCPDTAAELAQETFVQLLTQLDAEQEQGRESVGPLLISIMKSRVGEHGRQQERDQEIAAELSISPELYARPSDVEHETKVLREALLGALASLTPRLRNAAKLFHLDGLTYEQVARRLGISRAASYERIRRANKLLAAMLADYNEGTDRRSHEADAIQVVASDSDHGTCRRAARGGPLCRGAVGRRVVPRRKATA